MGNNSNKNTNLQESNNKEEDNYFKKIIEKEGKKKVLPVKVGDYTLREKIGSGSYGDIFLAKKNNSFYAVKKMEKDVEKNHYFMNEIINIKKLDHPNIIKYIDCLSSKDNFYLIMEYCNGGDLSDALVKYQNEKQEGFPQEIVQYLMKQIINGVNYLHKNNIIHRDIKPGNFVINFPSKEDKNNFNLLKAEVKIIDFGFSCINGKDGAFFSKLGSWSYMDPFLLNVDDLFCFGQKADIWSLGILCYKLLIGRVPFYNESELLMQQLLKIGTYRVPISLSKEAISFINGMLQYQPSKRLSCEELSKHPFLSHDVKDFQEIELKKVEKQLDNDTSELKINIKLNKYIWNYFNGNGEEIKQVIETNPIFPESIIPEIPIKELVCMENTEDPDSFYNDLIKLDDGP